MGFTIVYLQDMYVASIEADMGWISKSLAGAAGTVSAWTRLP